MRTSSQLLLNFLLNAAWQIALIAALASLGTWLLRSSAARYRHVVWVSALCLAFLVHAITSIRGSFETPAPTTIEPIFTGEPFRSLDDSTIVSRNVSPFTFQVNTDLALILIGITLLFAVSLLLLVPCVAAAAFNMRFDLETLAQNPTQQEQDRK